MSSNIVMSASTTEPSFDMGWAVYAPKDWEAMEALYDHMGEDPKASTKVAEFRPSEPHIWMGVEDGMDLSLFYDHSCDAWNLFVAPASLVAKRINSDRHENSLVIESEWIAMFGIPTEIILGV